ncbi:hypothetical protein NDU88_007103 [Pleurodeles waltl]|uniref:Reverse transcriptase n=1 Tax=Pleurodeles waltl TaxID=8319 RepID=A0AAV7ME71_PLEWA|nr:hypothetical protein NDU88_007103 [Pleurodeles waltl]
MGRPTAQKAPQGTEPVTHETLQALHTMGHGRHLVRWIYRGIRAQFHISLDVLKATWVTDIGRDINDKEWSFSLQYAKQVSRNTRFKLIQFYLFHQAYLTPHRLNRIYHTTTLHCPRSHAADADLLHVLWSCPSLTQYWNAIGATLAEIMDESIGLSPAFFLLGLHPWKRASKVRMRFMDLDLLLAKCQLTRCWKSPHAPSLLSWKEEVLRCSQAESAALRREECRGLRRKPMSLEWDSLVEELRTHLKT